MEVLPAEGATGTRQGQAAHLEMRFEYSDASISIVLPDESIYHHESRRAAQLCTLQGRWRKSLLLDGQPSDPSTAGVLRAGMGQEAEHEHVMARRPTHTCPEYRDCVAQMLETDTASDHGLQMDVTMCTGKMIMGNVVCL